LKHPTPKAPAIARRGRKLPTVLTEEERVALLQQPNQHTLTGLRNACLLTVMLDAGLRASEVLHVHIHDVDWKRGKILVKQGKGKKDRVLWLNESAMERLRQWKTTRKKQTELLFSTHQGRHINSSYLRVMVKRYARQAKIFKDVHPHTLRHTFATDLYRSTKNIRLTQKALGHSDLSTTMIYTHLVDDELEEALKSFRTA
jgi:integrase/recombinase XerD